MFTRIPGWAKFAIGLFAGGGVGLVVIDRCFAAGNPQYWNGAPPEGMFTGIGVGLIVSAAVWLFLFIGGRADVPKERFD